VASVGVLSRDELSDVVAVVGKLNVNSVAGTSASEAEAELLKCWQAFEYDSGKPPAATSSFPQYLFQWVLPYLRRVKLITILLMMSHAYSRVGTRTLSHKEGIRVVFVYHDHVVLSECAFCNYQLERFSHP
jgi:hypothetical protein